MAIIDDVVAYYKQVGTLKGTARLAHISAQKVRKLLITAGVIQPEMSREALLYLSRGLEKPEVAEKLGISVRVLGSYLPYSRMPYCQPTRSQNAVKLSRWRETGTTLPNKRDTDRCSTGHCSGQTSNN